MRAAGLGGCCSLQRRCLDWVTATMTTAAILLIAQLPLGFAECWEAIVNPYFDCQWENHHCGMTCVGEQCGYGYCPPPLLPPEVDGTPEECLSAHFCQNCMVEHPDKYFNARLGICQTAAEIGYAPAPAPSATRDGSVECLMQGEVDWDTNYVGADCDCLPEGVTFEVTETRDQCVALCQELEQPFFSYNVYFSRCWCKTSSEGAEKVYGMLSGRTDLYMQFCAEQEPYWDELWTYAIVFGSLAFLVGLGVLLCVVIGNKKGTYCFFC